MKCFVVLLLIAASSGCTARQAYDVIRASERSSCDRLPDTERERCLARTADDFETFERKRAQSQQPCTESSEGTRQLCSVTAAEDLEAFERRRIDGKR